MSCSSCSDYVAQDGHQPLLAVEKSRIQHLEQSSVFTKKRKLINRKMGRRSYSKLITASWQDMDEEGRRIGGVAKSAP